MITMHAISAAAFAPMLRALDGVLEKGAAHASAKKFDAEVFANERLAPDMMPLPKHVVIACDVAEEALARLAGQTFEKPGGRDETYAAARARLAQTIARIDEFPASALDGADARAIRIPISDEMGFEMTGLEYLRDWALPQLHFHAAIVYAILRNDGVELGMRDWGAAAGAHLRRRDPAFT